MAQVTGNSDLSNNKVYTVTTARGAWCVDQENNRMHYDANYTTSADTPADDVKYQFAFINYEGHYYLYAPAVKKFVQPQKHFVSGYTTPVTLAVNNGDVKVKGERSALTINIGGSQWTWDTWSSYDDGNKVSIVEAADFSTADLNEAISILTGTPHFDPHKVYTITCPRLQWAASADRNSLSSTISNADATEADKQFAFYYNEGKLYIFSVGAGKFLNGDGSFAIGKLGEPMDYRIIATSGYDHMLYVPSTSSYFNAQNSGGYAINTWSSADDGNMQQIVEVEGVDAYDAMYKVLNPSYSVTYVVKDEANNTIFTSEPIATELGATITTLPKDFQRPYYTYNEVNVTISQQATTVEFTAKWNGPFQASTDFANAHWYDMAVRGSYYVTTDNPKEDSSLAPVLANAVGLVENSYQWAFVGNGYTGFKLFNKAKGAEQAYAWVSNDNGSIPTFVDAAKANAWTIKPSTSSVSNSFMLTTDLGYQTNQFGGASGSLKIWASTRTDDAGSAFTIFDVPTNFAEFVASDIAPYVEATGYFSFTDAAKTAIGYDPAYETECPFETYKSIKEKLAAAMSDINNFVLPETGYYNLKNKNYGTYLGIDPSDANMYGNYKVCNLPKQIVKLTKNNDNTYTIGLMGKFAPATVAQSKGVTATADAANYTVVITKPGYAVFQANTEENYSCLHCASGGAIVGWEAAADASMWEILEPGYIEYTVGEAGYATAYFPFAVTIPETEKVAVPEAKGVWTFDDGTTGSLTATDGVTVADGVATVPVGDNLAMSTTGLTDLNTYTFMMDIKVPADKASDNSLSAYTSLFRGADNSGDGGLFIFYKAKENSRKIGIAAGNMGYGSSIELDKWYRVVFSCENAIPTVYVDGVKAVAATVASTNHWTLGEVVRFFADNAGDSEENAVQTTEIRFWDVALNATEAKMLGSVGTTPIVETKTVSAYTGSIMGNWIQTTEVTDGIIPEATPVILKGDPFTYKFKVGVFEEEDPENALKIYDKTVDGGKALAKRQVIPEPVLNNDLRGTFEPISAEGKYVLAKPEGKDVCFYQAISGNIEPCKAYLELNSEVKAFYINFDGNATAIENVNANGNNNNDAIYNLAGQKLSKLQKGINIVNGKKILK